MKNRKALIISVLAVAIVIVAAVVFIKQLNSRESEILNDLSEAKGNIELITETKDDGNTEGATELVHEEIIVLTEMETDAEVVAPEQTEALTEPEKETAVSETKPAASSEIKTEKAEIAVPEVTETTKKTETALPAETKKQETTKVVKPQGRCRPRGLTFVIRL